MTAPEAAPAVTLDAELVASLQEQLARLGPDEPYLAVVAGGRVFVRSTRGVLPSVIRLWRKHPAMMVPDAAGYRPGVHVAAARDL